jgi:hypothetical protein
MQRNHLSLTAAAQALGLTRRAIVYYHGGHRPIPKLVGLACKGWEAIRRREDREDLAAFDQRSTEPTITYEKLRARLEAGKP